MNVTTMESKTYEDGSEVLVVAYNFPTEIVQLTFWQGRSAEDAPEEDDWTVTDFEDYVRALHDEVVLNNVCGFDQYMDNHYSYDGSDIDSFHTFIGDWADQAESLGLKYHYWSMEDMGSGETIY